MSAATYLVMFACNDDRGMPSGHVAAVHICWDGGDRRATLEAPTVRGPTFRWEIRERGPVLKLSRRVFGYVGEKSSWVGNWVWDACPMEGSELLKLVLYLFDLEFDLTEWTYASDFSEDAAP